MLAIIIDMIHVLYMYSMYIGSSKYKYTHWPRHGPQRQDIFARITIQSVYPDHPDKNKSIHVRIWLECHIQS